jgi:purine nucleosidase
MYIYLRRLFFVWFCLAFSLQGLMGQQDKFFGEKISVPKIPPKGEKIKVLIVSDATNEIDDVWAISLALLYPERFEIVGFVGSNYDHTHSGIGPKSVGMSVREINRILARAGMPRGYPVMHGAHPMQYEFMPSKSEGVDFIVEQALLCSPENPLWVVGLGSATDLASAYLTNPTIARRVVMFWHARTENTWPHRAHNYNIKGDMHAARMMFHAPFPLVLFDTGTHLYAGPIEETNEYVRPYGPLGEYLYEYRLKNSYYLDPKKGYFDLGDIAALLDPDIATWEEIDCPRVTYYMDYDFKNTNGKILRCKYVDRDKTFQYFYDGLKRHHEKGN